MYLALAAQMRELDRQTIEDIGIPGMVLMENAGRGTVDQMEQSFGPVRGKTVCIFAGPGNNGGDGLVIARTVHCLGAFPFVFFLLDPAELKGDAALNFALLQHLELPYQVLDTPQKRLSLIDTALALSHIHPMHCLVDALFGIGLERELSGPVLDLVNDINSLRQGHQGHRVPVVCLDIPSGLDSDTGTVLGGAVQADLTVTYGLPKPGLFHHGGSQVGQLARIDIGIPPQVIAKMALHGTLLDAADTASRLRHRPARAHKGSSGHLLILGGSTGMTGAALLCGQGALRSGAGLVSFAVPADLNPIFETAIAEAMSVPLSASCGFLSIDDYEQIKTLAAGKNSLVIGPGIGTREATAELVLRLYTENTSPMVVDADALTLLAAHPESIKRPAGPRIFTPHPGEMARLLGSSIEQIQANRLMAAQWLNSEAEAGWPPLITVLKGAGTVVAAASGAWAINTSGNPGMATGGMGDVLAGIIGALLAQGYDPWEAACLGVSLHGLAADRIATDRPYGYTASEVAQMLPQVLGTLLPSKNNKEKLC